MTGRMRKREGCEGGSEEEGCEGEGFHGGWMGWWCVGKLFFFFFFKNNIGPGGNPQVDFIKQGRGLIPP